MENSKIDFNNITNLNYSNTNNNNNHNNDINDNEYYNQNILIYGDDDVEMLKSESKRKNKSEFERIMNQTIKSFISLSKKSISIINSKSFSLKSIIANNYNIQPPISKEKNDTINNKLINSSSNNLTNNINMGDSINGTNELSNIKNFNGRNHFMINDPMNNNYNFTSSIFKQSSIENKQEKLIGKKRRSEKNNNSNEKLENEKKNIFNEIVLICNEISNFNNDIIKREEQSNFINDNEHIETTIIINNIRIATIYLNGDVVNKIYIFKNDKNFIKENEILAQLKNIKKNMNAILYKLKKMNS